MDPIRPTQAPPLLDALRRITRKSGHTQTATGPREAAAAATTLRDDLQRLVEQANVDDPQALADIRQPLLRRILIAEWDDSASGDAEFEAMLATVDHTIAADPRLQDVIRQAVLALQATT